jgi:hypothetical protein
MGPVNWLAVVLAASAAFLLGGLWYGALFGKAKMDAAGPGVAEARTTPLRTMGTTLLLALVSASLLGHLFARLSDPSKWWLYPMMSGGVALGFVIPALLTSYTHQRIAPRVMLIDAGYWLLAYLAMGAVFFSLS